MTDEISDKILSQNTYTYNIRELIDLNVRIDERVKSIQLDQKEIELKLENLGNINGLLMQEVAVLKSSSESIQFEECKKQIIELDKRLMTIEHTSKGMQNKWRQIGSFFIQLVWITLAAWVLYKLGLNPPPIP